MPLELSVSPATLLAQLQARIVDLERRAGELEAAAAAEAADELRDRRAQTVGIGGVPILPLRPVGEFEARRVRQHINGLRCVCELIAHTTAPLTVSMTDLLYLGLVVQPSGLGFD